ncbi:hypothetical protein DPMN_185400 [Dreissena polymorpha]|uniref:Uncharacterized protein n=1 Tax=Dreissena polymorpha TaxID=45954 RepID=A0A9D4I799_DREPO|nr:hypothetical protein DPMN_185400 [Dreissena polymorpha]
MNTYQIGYLTTFAAVDTPFIARVSSQSFQNSAEFQISRPLSVVISPRLLVHSARSGRELR